MPALVRKKNIEIIVDACVKVNSEIQQRRHWEKVDPQFDGTDEGIEQLSEPEIRLTDILQAIRQVNPYEYFIDVYGEFWHWPCTNGVPYQEGAPRPLDIHWNLRMDSLVLQKDDCIILLAFILRPSPQQYA